MNDFGFTNDKKNYNKIKKFKNQAIKDGWDIKPTYLNKSIRTNRTAYIEIIQRINKHYLIKEKKITYWILTEIWYRAGSGEPISLLYNEFIETTEEKLKVVQKEEYKKAEKMKKEAEEFILKKNNKKRRVKNI